MAAVGLVVIVEYGAGLAARASNDWPDWIPVGTDAGDGLIQPLLLVLAQIGAVLLGLFFAAVGVVASTVYADAPPSARSLFVWERANRVYARSLSALVAATISILVAQVLGHEPSQLIVLLLSTYTAVAVLALVVIAPRTFAFFDPLETTPPLFAALAKWQGMAAQGGYRWDDGSFQAHYRRQAEAILGQLNDVARYAFRTKRSHAERFGRLARELLAAWSAYSTAKSSIPLDSHWHERKYAHPNWSLAEYHRTGTALATKTPLTPDQEPDHLWIERRLSTMVREALGELLGRGEYRAAISVVTVAGSLAREMYTRIQYKEFEVLWSAVTDSLWSRLDQIAAGSRLTDEEAALVDGWASIPIEATISLGAFAASQSPEVFSEQIARAMEQPNGIYEGGALSPLLKRLERSTADRELEVVAEGHVVSPIWFTTQMAARTLVKELDRATAVVMHTLDNDVGNRASSLAAEKPHLSATIVSRGIEACNKLEAHLPTVANQIEALATLQRTPDDQWPDTHYSRWLQSGRDVYRTLLQAAVKVLNKPDSLPAGPDLPDQFGQFRSLIADELFESMLRGDEAAFAEYLQSYLGTIEAAQRRSLLATPENNPQARILAAIEPWSTAFELSGYALFFSKLEDKTFWHITKTTWSALFDALSDPAVTIQGITAGLLYRESIFALKPGDVQRSNRKQRFEAELDKRGLLHDDLERHLVWDEDPRADEEVDPVVALFLNSPSFHDLEDLFLSEHIFRLPMAASLSIPRGVEQLRESLDHRTRRTPADTPEGEDDSEG